MPTTEYMRGKLCCAITVGDCYDAHSVQVSWVLLRDVLLIAVAKYHC
jgi:hypothetical protein